MKKSANKPLHFILPAVLIVLLILAVFFKVKSGFISPIPEDTIGNTAGNIRGEGLFCEYEGKVYFSNPYDNGALYAMNPDGTEMEKLLSTTVSYINAGGKYLFYYLESRSGGTGLGFIRATTGIYRSKLNGRESSCLDQHMATMMTLVGENLYCQHYDNEEFSTLHKIPAAGSDRELELSSDIVETASVSDGKIYYSGLTKDHYLYAWDTHNDTSTLVWDGNTSYPTVIGNDVYFMNVDYDYRLFRYNLIDGELTALTRERLDGYNIYDNVVFYQTNGTDSPALMRMNLDGSNPEIVREGVYNRINVTSAYTYFQPFDDDSVIYRTPTFGAVAVDEFPEALQAAEKYREEGK